MPTSPSISSASCPSDDGCDAGSTDTRTSTETVVVHQSFSIQYDFPVVFTQRLFEESNLELLRVMNNDDNKRHRALVFLDAGVTQTNVSLVSDIAQWFESHKTNVELAAPVLVVDAGETLKSDWEHLERMQAAIRDNVIDRHSYVIAIGGGALLDAAGLVAATAHRGIRHIRIPTTVLAQNDSGVGVKNGINQYGQKNYLGTFAPPWAVINDSAFLDTLPVRDARSGMAEAVKVALIRDAAFYTWLEREAPALSSFDSTAVQYLVRRCAELHMHQIAHGGDPFELGSARPLDFGHWAAHRLETLTNHRLRHGEAVAIGIALDTHYSVLTGLLAPGKDKRVASLLQALGFELWDDALDAVNAAGESELLTGLEHFRTHLGGELTITLLQDIGVGVEVHDMDSDKVMASIDWLRAMRSEAS